MYCTIVENGNESVKNLINQTNYGLYISSICEAHFDHKSGIVRCFVDKAFIIEKGRISNTVVKCIVEDNVIKFLENVYGLSNDMLISSGLCYSSSGNIYIEYGSPTMYIKNINIGEVYIYDK